MQAEAQKLALGEREGVREGLPVKEGWRLALGDTVLLLQRLFEEVLLGVRVAPSPPMLRVPVGEWETEGEVDSETLTVRDALTVVVADCVKEGLPLPLLHVLGVELRLGL